jgi:hypothetical protein
VARVEQGEALSLAIADAATDQALGFAGLTARTDAVVFSRT